MKISAVILTKNEEKNIERCLRSIEFCDEIIVIDDYSEDETVNKVYKVHQVHKVHKVYKVFKRKLNGDFAGQRNFAMEKAQNEWILFVDADEEITQELRDEIVQNVGAILKSPERRANRDSPLQNIAYYIKRRDFFWGRELRYGETRKISQIGLIRLMRKNSGKWIGKAHEEYKIGSWKFEVGSLKNYINHYPHQSIKEFLLEVNFYSTLRAKELLEGGKRTNILEIMLFPLGKLIFTYFLKLGFLDGPAGFTYAFMMSFHSFLVRTKLYEFTRIRKQINTNH